MNIIELQNLVVTSTGKKGHFKFTGKIKSVTEKSEKLSQWHIILFSLASCYINYNKTKENSQLIIS